MVKRWFGFGLVGLCLLGVTVARAQTAPQAPPALDPVKRACALSYERGQLLRRQNKLLGALDQLLICSQERCPQIARRDCARWLGEVEAAIPSVVLRFVDERGREREDVAVSIDGVLAVSRLGAAAVPLDPGRHRLVFSPAGAGPETREITIRVGEKNRLVSVDRSRPTSSMPLSLAPAEVPRTGPHPVAYVVGAVGVIGWGMFAGFGGRSLVVEGDYRDNCAPFCSSEQIDELEQLRVGADIALAVAAVATVAGVTIAALTWRSSKEPATKVGSLQLRAKAGGITLRGEF